MPACVMTLEMQAAGRDDAEQTLQGSKGDAALAAFGQAGRFTSLQTGFEPGWQTIGQVRDWITEAGALLWQAHDGGFTPCVRMVISSQRSAGS